MTRQPAELDALAFAIGRLSTVDEPAARIRMAGAFRDGLGREDDRLRRIILEAMLELRAETPSWTWEQLGDLLGVTTQRASQMVKEYLRQNDEARSRYLASRNITNPQENTPS